MPAPKNPRSGLPQAEDRGLQRTDRLFLAERALTQGMLSLHEGAFFDGFALALGATTYHIGLLSAARFLGGAGQLLTEPLLLRLGSRKRHCLWAAALGRTMRVGVMLLPYAAAVALAGEPALRLLLVFRFLMAAADSSGDIVLLGWMTDGVPRERRGVFLSLRNAVMGMAKLPIAFIGSFFLDRWRDPVSRHASLGAFQGIFAAGLALGLISWAVLTRIPDDSQNLKTPGEPFWKRVRHPFQDPRYRPYLWFRLAWTFSVGFAADFFNVYLLRFLGLPYLWITVTDLVGDGCSLLTARLWGRWIDRYGARPVLILACLVKSVFPLLWIIVMPGWWWLIFLPMLLRTFNSATETSMLHLSLHLPPEGEREGYMAVERSLVHPVRALPPLLAGLLARTLEGWHWHLGAFHFDTLHLLFLVSGILRFGATLMLLRVSEPGSRSFRSLTRAALHRLHPQQSKPAEP